MASISKRPNGRYFVQFTAPDGIRRTLAIGTKSERQATLFASKVEDLVMAAKLGVQPAPEVREWLAKLKSKMREALASYGVTEKPSTDNVPKTIGWLIDTYTAGRSDVKLRTLDRMRVATKHMIDHLGRDTLLTDVTPGDVEEMGRKMREKLGDNTVRRRLSYCKQFFRFALRKRLILENPFGDLKGLAVRENRARDYFVTRDECTKILKACPNDQWRAIFALARFGGLRVPSELLELRWADVNWDTGRMVIRSPKTEHFEDKASRVIPIFPELRPHLDALWFDEIRGDAEFVIDRCRDQDRNHRTTMTKIIKRAGLSPWPKLFQNLRASRATELAGEFPAHVAAEWLGHSALVAQKHYWRTTDSDFEKAIKPTEESAALQKRCTRNANRDQSGRGGTENRPLSPIGTHTDQNQYAQQDSNLRPTD